MPKIHDRVLILLCGTGLIAICSCGFLERAPNRLASSTPLPLRDAPGLDAVSLVISLAAFLPLAFVAAHKARSLATFGAALVLLFSCLAAAGHFATALTAPDNPALRLSLGPAFWISVGVALLAMLDAAQRARLGLATRSACAALVLAGVSGMALAGMFDSLSLAKEFVSQRAIFSTELWRHLFLVGTALVLGLILSIPLVALILHSETLRGPVSASLGLVQTIPSIALFGVLITPLSALAAALPVLKDIGIGGTGPAPAIIALTLYSLFPLVRGFYVGLDEVPPAVKDAALGIGYDRRRLFLDVELPLALPALLSSLRVVTIQAIGLAAVAALIGAGGLGTFVFRGIGQYALDLVLVGAIPIVLLALAADLVFQVATGLARR